ncbi:MAG: HD domain-containing protein [Acidobacteria bacterium]|nr:HD domain-containing protein [Acidobacteriota bacterium]
MFADRKEFKEVAAALLTGQRSLALYPAGHPHIKVALEDCFRVLRTLLQRERQIPIVLAGNEFVVGDLQIPIAGEAFEELAKSLRHAGVEKLIFVEDLRSWEVRALLRALNMDEDALEAAGGVETILESDEVEHIVATSLALKSSNDDLPDMLVRAWETYTAGLRVIRRLRQGYRNSGRLENLDETKEFVRDIVELGAQQTQPLLALQSLKVHDEYSFTHSINVATLTLAMAQGLNFGKYDLHEATLAAILHDIGKERVSGELLRKPGRLDDTEWKEMADHNLHGAKMLATTDGVGDLAAIVAYEHHLTQDRTGPGAAKWRLHLVSEIVTIADVYDALRSKRPYRGEIPADRAMEIMHEEAPKKFNPDLFAGFAKLVGYYPPGICVRLDNNEVGIVYRANPDALRQPAVLVVHGADGTKLGAPRRVDLASSNGSEKLTVAEVLAAEDAGVDPFDYL